MHEQIDQVLSQLNDIWRNRWPAVAAAWIIALGGWYGVHRMPDRYETSARIYVDTQTVLRPLLSGIAVQPNLDQMVQMMSRTLISRPNLEKVIEMNHLDVGLKAEAERAELIAHLIADIVVASGGKENLYAISFFDKDPKVAAQVVQSRITLFV